MKNTCSFYTVFQVLKVLFVKICMIQPPDLLFLVLFISLYINRNHFSQIFRTSFNIWKKKENFFCHKFSFLNGFTKHVDAPLQLTDNVVQSPTKYQEKVLQTQKNMPSNYLARQLSIKYREKNSHPIPNQHPTSINQRNFQRTPASRTINTNTNADNHRKCFRRQTWWGTNTTLTK